MAMQKLTTYSVWDRTTRIFHWVNFLTVLSLIGVGLVIFNAKSMGISTEGKILLKTIHVYAGYIFALNLFWRIVWAFIGGTYSRWHAILPGGKGYKKALLEYLQEKRTSYLGHNPVGRIAVTILLVTLFVQAITGLVLAGTDIYFPPFGSAIAEWVAAPGTDPASLVPYAKEMVDAEAYAEMREFRSFFIKTHIAAFYTLLVLIVLHIAAVIRSEIKHGGTIISAMFTGKKAFSQEPADKEGLES